MTFIELLNHFNERVTVIPLIHLSAFPLQNPLVVDCKRMGLFFFFFSSMILFYHGTKSHYFDVLYNPSVMEPNPLTKFVVRNLSSFASWPPLNLI